MALFYDVTKAANSKQLSGLIRVSKKLRQALEKELGGELVPVEWHLRKRCFRRSGQREIVNLSADHHFITPEVFSSKNRPGLFESLEGAGVKSAAVFHDAIPYKYPEITWPKSVERHPQYMCDLAGVDRVFSVSQASQNDLDAYWEQRGISVRPVLETITLGADFFNRSERCWNHRPAAIPLVLNVGIVEPRKNQAELLEVACGLWDKGHDFELHFVGRINPHYGKGIEKQIKRARKSGYPVHLHSKQSDDLLLDLYARSHFTVFNSLTEGFGLPVAESLWLGIPCISKRLPSLSDIVDGVSCRAVDSTRDLESAMLNWLTDGRSLQAATRAAQSRRMPTWDQTILPILKWREGR